VNMKINTFMQYGCIKSNSKRRLHCVTKNIFQINAAWSFELSIVPWKNVSVSTKNMKQHNWFQHGLENVPWAAN